MKQKRYGVVISQPVFVFQLKVYKNIQEIHENSHQNCYYLGAESSSLKTLIRCVILVSINFCKSIVSLRIRRTNEMYEAGNFAGGLVY